MDDLDSIKLELAASRHNHKKDNEYHQAEIERLRVTLQGEMNDADWKQEMRAEIERLNTALDLATDINNQWVGEVERLRREWASENTERTNELMEAEESARLWKISRETNRVTAEIAIERAHKAEVEAAEWRAKYEKLRNTLPNGL